MQSYTNIIEVLISGDIILFAEEYNSNLINTENIAPADGRSQICDESAGDSTHPNITRFVPLLWRRWRGYWFPRLCLAQG